MIHFLTLLVCISSVEIYIRSNFTLILFSILKLMRIVVHILPHNKISDHWKERAIPAYALKMMKYCLQILLILTSIIFLFFIANYCLKGFLDFSFSLFGLIETVFFALGYSLLRKFFTR